MNTVTRKRAELCYHYLQPSLAPQPNNRTTDMTRIPTPEKVASLSRDEWELLCRALCVAVYQAEGVEDRTGRGNGMDCWRLTPEGLEGFQARRLDQRFGQKQAAKLIQNIGLAAQRAKAEFRAPLTRFVFLVNIDLQPGHGREKGEIQRFAELKEQALQEHGVSILIHGVTWVHTQLLLHPNTRPDLFEDLAAQIQWVHRELAGKIDALAETQRSAETTASRLNAALAVLLREARVHFQRGIEHHSQEQLSLAARCMRDALNLVQELQMEPVFQGQVALLLSNVECHRGRLEAAEAAARSAISLLTEASEDLHLARGNLGAILSNQQRYDEAEGELRAVLEYFEDTGNIVETVRTLTHLFELERNRKCFPRAITWGVRLERALTTLENVIGQTDVGCSGLGALALGWVHIGQALNNATYIRQALPMLEHTRKMGESNGSVFLELTAQTALAQAIWFLDQPEDAARKYAEIAERAWPEHGKLAADSLFNAALALTEARKASAATDTMVRALRLYREIGDVASAADAQERLDAWRHGQWA